MMIGGDDTLVGISSANGNAAQGILRFSGSRAVEIALKILRAPNSLSLRGHYQVVRGKVALDFSPPVETDAVLYVMRGPHSYTREDVVEIHCCGNQVVLWRLLRSAFEHGARQALPGEFTKRAFLNGRLDLAQAEAVIQLIRSRTAAESRAAFMTMSGGLSQRIRDIRQNLTETLAQIEAALDFSEEDIRFISPEELQSRLSAAVSSVEKLAELPPSRVLAQSGVRVALLGPSNAGKSSLFNALLGREEALVSPELGTTRDYLRGHLRLSNIEFVLADAAGILPHTPTDEPARIAEERAADIARWADFILWTIDGSQKNIPLPPAPLLSVPVILVINKSDLPTRAVVPGKNNSFAGVVQTSAVTGSGMELLKNKMTELVRRGELDVSGAEFLLTERHHAALKKAGEHLRHAQLSATSAGEECVSEELRAALSALGEVTGETFTEGLLDHIFTHFCVGK